MMTPWNATRAMELADEAYKADEYSSVYIVDPMADMLRAAVDRVRELEGYVAQGDVTCERLDAENEKLRAEIKYPIGAAVEATHEYCGNLGFIARLEAAEKVCEGVDLYESAFVSTQVHGAMAAWRAIRDAKEKG